MSDAQAVLYVDDEAVIRELAVFELEEAGFKVVFADSGAAALGALDDAADVFCAMVTDVNLGVGPDGWEVARHARQLNTALPVIYVSGASGHEWRSNSVPDSILIAKPFTMM